LRTTGAAIVHGRHGLLLDAGLHPLELDSARRTAILGRAGKIQRQCRPGDAPSLAGRIADRLGPAATWAALQCCRDVGRAKGVAAVATPMRPGYGWSACKGRVGY